MAMHHFPEKGQSPASILDELDHLRQQDIPWEAGKTWSLIYYLDDAHQDLVRRAYDSYFSANYLNSFVFPGLQQIEREVVRMAGELCHLSTSVGGLTSGGTESILLAVLACREAAKKKAGKKRRRDILAPATVHPAFEKAAHLYGLRLVRIPVLEDQRLDVEAMKRQIGPETLMLVASAPCYPFGVIDPIEGVAELALEEGLPLHVDACLGGFLLPWAERLGYVEEPWDFRVKGVTSISLDVHKFGFAAKGASVLLYRDMEQMKHQFFISTRFPGGMYVSPTLLGTRPGGAVAAAWAAIRHLGAEGYLAMAQPLFEGADRIRRFIGEIPELELVGTSRLNILAFRTVANRPDIFVLADFLEEKGWMVDRQQFPPCIHLTVLPTNLPVIGDYLDDLEAAVEFGRTHPAATAKGGAAMYGVMARLPFRGMIEKEVSHLFETLYGAEQEGNAEAKPSWWMGLLNRLLLKFG
ncbi:MAG: aspartate aminotransferase family protein [Lewinellaceae bacterium]|nr:aspartate aminotransferase family protein [Lewinellaceae bacterium]